VVKAWLSQQGVVYAVRDLNTDAAARAEFLRRGFRLPPVVVVNGAAVEGYQPQQLEALLEQAGAFADE